VSSIPAGEGLAPHPSGPSPTGLARPGTRQSSHLQAFCNGTQEIALTATDGSLRYYWSYDGTPTWYQGQIAPPGYATSSPP
jgi:hypothetical protein